MAALARRAAGTRGLCGGPRNRRQAGHDTQKPSLLWRKSGLTLIARTERSQCVRRLKSRSSSLRNSTMACLAIPCPIESTSIRYGSTTEVQRASAAAAHDSTSLRSAASRCSAHAGSGPWPAAQGGRGRGTAAARQLRRAIRKGHWGQPETAAPSFAGVFDTLGNPRAASSRYRLSVICQSDLASRRTGSGTCARRECVAPDPRRLIGPQRSPCGSRSSARPAYWSWRTARTCWSVCASYWTPRGEPASACARLPTDPRDAGERPLVWLARDFGRDRRTH